MELWQAAVLGLVQGVTEFLPVSSSGHLRVAEHFTGLKEPQTLFDVALHVGTLVAIILFFRKDLFDFARSPFRAVVRLRKGEGPEAVTADPGLRALFFIGLGSIPTAFIGYYFGKYMEHRSSSLLFVAAMFIINSFILFGSRYIKLPVGSRRMNRGFVGMRFYDALVVGTIQGLAVARGISRSGSTISAAMMMGVERDTAGRFSFLLSIPAIIGATLFSLREFELPADMDATLLLTGAGIAMVSGAISLKVLMDLVRKGKIYTFGIYTLILGTGLVVWYYCGDALMASGRF